MNQYSPNLSQLLRRGGQATLLGVAMGSTLVTLPSKAQLPTPALQCTFDQDLGNDFAADSGVAPPANGFYYANQNTASTPSTISLTTNTPSGLGYALNLLGANNGMNNYAACGNPAKLNNLSNFTLTAWINLQGNPNSGDRIMDKVGSGAVNGFGWDLAGTNAAAVPLQLYGNGKNVATTATVNAGNAWVFVAVTYDGTLTNNNVRFYSGGAGTAVAPLGGAFTLNAGGITNTTDGFRVGSTQGSGSDRTPPAWVDDVRVYANAVLTAAELETVREQNCQPGTILTVIAGGIGSNANAANYGETLTLQATVFPTPPDGEPVDLLDGTNAIATGYLTNGLVFFMVTNLAGGTHCLTASYPGDAQLAATTSGVVSLTVVSPPAGYYLAWSDEFNASTLNSQNWQMYLPGQFIDTSSGNTNAYCVPNAMVCNGSNLVQTVYTANGSNFMGMIMSQGRFTFKYGYVEANILRDAASGVDQCFWIQSPKNGAYIGNPGYEGEEVDLAEHWNADTNLSVNSPHGEIRAGVDWNGYGPEGDSSNSGWLGTNLGVGYHTYALSWTPTNYQFFVDGAKVWQPNSATPISQHSEFFIVSSAIHGGFAGAIPNGGYGPLSNSLCTFNVDYIRYFAPTSTVFWTGAADGTWTNAGNWVANRAPQAGNDIVFDYLATGQAGVMLSQPVALNSLTVLETPGPIAINGGSLNVGGGGLDLNSASSDLTLNSAVVLGASQTWSVGDTRSLLVNAAISGAGNLTIASYGSVILSATNTYLGATLVNTTNNGRLALSGSASLVNTTNIAIAAGATFDVSALTAGEFDFPASASLTAGGSGTTLGANAAAILGSPGGMFNLGSQPITLIYNGSAPALYLAQGTLALSNNAVRINSTAPLPAGVYPVIQQATGSVIGNGTLTVSGTAIGPGMAAALQITGASVNLVLANPPPPALAASLAGSAVRLSWPANYAGWVLQQQTNGLLATNPWVDIYGSSNLVSTNIPINPSWPTAFYRLRHP